MAKLIGVDDDKQNQLIQTLLEAIPGMMFHVKRDGTFLEFISSENSKPLLPPEEFLGKKIIDMMPPEIAKSQMLKIEELFTTGEPQIVEYHLPESGEMRWYEARFTVSGEDILVAVVRDITEKKKAEEALRLSENRFRSLIEQSPFGIIIYRSDGRLIFGNQAAKKLYGLSQEEYNYLLENYSILKDKQLVAKGFIPYMKKAFTGEGTAFPPVEYTLEKTTEKEVIKHSVWVEGSIYPIKDDQGHVREVVLMQSDVTERKQAEEEKRQRTRELTAINRLTQRVSSSLSVKQVIEEALQAVVDAVRPDLAMIFLRKGERLVLQGFSPKDSPCNGEEAPGHRVGECLCGLAVKDEKPIFSTNVQNDLRCTYTECKKTRVNSFAALPLRSGDNLIGVLGLASGTTRDFEEQAPFLQTLSNEMAIGLQNALFYEELQRYADKLEQRVAKRTAQLEEKTRELEQANAQLKRADQLKSVFLASMSHELRTPLNSIIGFTGILLMELAGKLNDEQKKQLKMVKNSADHLLNLINDILDISKIEAGRVDLSPERFLLDDVINEVTEIFSNQAAQKGLELIVNIPEKIFIFSDMRRFKQILINLVSNAVKFTNQGRITVTSTILPDERIETSVADTGIGIKEESMDKLFNPFQQVDMNLTKQFVGTGLGLYLCKSLVTLMGGEISAQSQYKKGSVFTFILPLKKKEK
jgi:PAS domain S-box-containing protein